MTLTDYRDIAYLDIADPTFSLRSEAVLAARKANWYARTSYGIAVLRYGEVSALLKDRRLAQGSRRWPEHNGVEGLFTEWWHRTLINLVGEDHKRQRRLLNPAFSARVIDRIAPTFVTLANELVDRFVDRGRCEFVSEFSQPYATRLICQLLGVGDDRWEQLAEWTGTMGLALGVTMRQEQQRIEESLRRLTEYADEVIAERRRNPVADDTVGYFMEARANGHVTELELEEIIVNMFFGGVETTRNQLGIAMDLFIQHPGQWGILREQPALAPNAIEEVMRVRPTTTWVTREALEDFTFEGLDIEQGTTVHLLTYVIGDDPRAYGEDVRFDITAQRPRQHGFGGGLHHCLGHFLARRDMTEALVVLSQRLGSPRYDGESTWLPDSGNTGPIALPIRFEALR